MQTSGSGYNGVLLVGEALGKDEAEAGRPFVGAAGAVLDKMLLKGGLKRDEFKIANVVWCKPPENKLSNTWYMLPAIEQCAPYLDAVIRDFKPKCIVALGAVASKRLLPDLPVGILEARGYVHWSEKYQVWVMPTVHPSFIMRGKTAWAQVLIHDLQRAVEIAKDGYADVSKSVHYTLDCTVSAAMKWVDEFEAYYAANPELYLSTDIETAGKDADEEALDLEDADFAPPLRCGYSYKKGHAISLPWDGPYRIVHDRLLGHPCQKLFWNGSFDIPRLLAAGSVINGACHDGMDAWHVLNSDLKKSLGFVTPFFYHGFPMWKHTSSEQPAWYNAADCDTAGVNMRGTVELLKKHGMWAVYNEFICELDPVYSSMTRAGMPVDLAKRIKSSKRLIALRENVRKQIEQLVPQEIKPLQPKAGYVREPKDTTGLSLVTFNGVKVTKCPVCGERDPKKIHFKSRQRKECGRCSAKWTAAHGKPRKKGNSCEGAPVVTIEDNKCAGAEAFTALEGDQRWAKVLPFVASTKGILTYQKAKNHPWVMTGKGKDKKPTTDEKAIKTLIGKWHDPFYEKVLEDRELTKLGGTYIGWWNEQTSRLEKGFPLGRDGRVHGHFRHTPSTLRSSMVSPNLQNIPRTDSNDPDAVQNLVKAMFVCPPGHVFVERDFSGIEAVLVGYHAGARDFYRLAKIDIHSYFTAHNLRRMGIITDADLPDLKWSDADLKLWGKKVIKAQFPMERDIGKRCIHAGDYRVGAKLLHDTYPTWFKTVKDAAMVLSFFYELFPEIEQWHKRICLQVDKTAVIKNSFGHAHRFYQVLKWERRGKEWDWDYGDDSKRLIAFGPQSDAAFIGKLALKRLYYNYPDTVARWLRLFIHDSIMCETPKDQAKYCDQTMAFEMEKPIEQMPLDPAWGYGDYVKIDSEEKVGECWADMAEWHKYKAA